MHYSDIDTIQIKLISLTVIALKSNNSEKH
jgi:hypothetical protein